MSIVGWILIGIIAGLLSEVIGKRSAGGLLADIIIGIEGAIVGGFTVGLLKNKDFLFTLNLDSLLAAAIGAGLVLLFYRFFTDERRNFDQ